MRAELLVVPDCAHQAGAASLLRTVLDEAGLGDVSVHTTVIDTLRAAQERGFVGSPTFLINGIDALGSRVVRPRSPVASIPAPTGLPAFPIQLTCTEPLLKHQGRRRPIHRNSAPMTALFRPAMPHDRLPGRSQQVPHP